LALYIITYIHNSLSSIDTEDDMADGGV